MSIVMDEGQAEYRPPLIDVAHLGEYDAMVVMRSRGKELCFVMRKDMPEEGFAECCARLRELVFSE